MDDKEKTVKMDRDATTMSPASRKRWGILGAVTVVVAAAAFVHWLRVRGYEETDDAFIDAHVAPMSSKVSGYVIAVPVDDNQPVKKGDLLVELDAADYQVAAARARAELAAAEAQARQARQDAARYAQLLAREQVSQQTADKAASDAAVDAAKADTARQRLAEAELQLSYTRITAPQDGRVARRSVEVQSYVQPGQPLMAVVPDQVYVTANFKETQLTRMRPGQPAEIRVDAFPGHRFKGHVDSVQPGTGARFSLLPPENATGNFVKVVQRVPVKIVFDEPTTNLAPGMSVVPSVKVR
jgi:membrane fusion protein (multidrug efflux system)